ncbi:hypothetical protein [Dipodfec virus UOA04_Rod_757]|nr:hypothetical protein [Dipodfec virus UOA04_Rod_757]
MKNKNITFSTTPSSASRYVLIYRCVSSRPSRFFYHDKFLDLSGFFDTSFDDFVTSNSGVQYSILCSFDPRHPKSLTAFCPSASFVKAYSLASARSLRSKFIRDFCASRDCFAIVDYDVFEAFYKASV